MPRTGDEAHELAVAERVLGLLSDAVGGEEASAAAEDRLAADDELLAAFFQSLDLLPSGDPVADSIAMLVVGAIGRLGE